jgi:aryl-alcohol dehydrogenase-like predicted oxidoreductase
MKYRKLGKNGPTVSAIGLGAGSATTDFGERDDQVQIETMQRAVDLGVTFFDTADRYMKGRHERLLGRALRGERRNQVIIATKFGNFDLAGGKKGYNGKPEYVAQACDASLANLGLDHIDLYYLHRIDPEVPIEETVGAMSRLVEQGKVRWLGLSEAGPKSLARACRVHTIAALQTEYSLWARDVEEEILPKCRELGIGFVPYSPLGRGLLTGNVRSIDDLAPHDVRRKQPRFQPENIGRNLALLEPIAKIAKDRGVSQAQVALAWLLAQGEDIVPIPGTKQQKWLEQNVAAVDLALGRHELDLLAATFKPGARAGDRYTPGYFVTLGA